MRLVCCALLLAGCYDFSRFDHLSDQARPDDLPLADLAPQMPDFATSDLATELLVSDSFDDLVQTSLWTRWQPIVFPSGQESKLDFAEVSSPSADTGSGSLFVDVTRVSQQQMMGYGELLWVGSMLPSTPLSLHLRLYFQMDALPTQDVNVASLVNSSGEGIELTLQPKEGMVDIILNEFGSEDAFGVTGFTIDSSTSSTWHCAELGLAYEPGGNTWFPSLWFDGVQATAVSPSPVHVTFSTQPNLLEVGFSMASSTLSGTGKAYVDAVQLDSGDGVIGCLP